MKEASEKDFKKIFTSTMHTYNQALNDYLLDKPHGSLTDADVTLMIMNLTISISTNVYYSLKTVLPNSPVDYEFLRVKIINTLVKEFDEIKAFTPDSQFLNLTVDQVTEIFEKGFAMVTMPDGEIRKVMKEDVLVKKEEVEELIKKKQEERKDACAPKIITQSR